MFTVSAFRIFIMLLISYSYGLKFGKTLMYGWIVGTRFALFLGNASLGLVRPRTETSLKGFFPTDKLKLSTE